MKEINNDINSVFFLLYVITEDRQETDMVLVSK